METFKLRKIVTGHDEHGKSVVVADGIVTGEGDRPGESSAVIWVSRGFPVDNDVANDISASEQRTSEDDGAVFRIIRYEPGVAPRHHRTNSIDYVVVMSGMIDMVLDQETVTLNAGDTLVQRGTIHNWINHGPEPCIVAFALIGAHPVNVHGRTLLPTG